ncbi:hypothetical protein PV328_004095 [Microctonus aethiopoides]|uniref:Uncharacterized protein n=1 Tax=Microctonus aethiopoides TaxID=144406 RepID=A0AA39F9W1_9HYME|nr:hypothetical protein PV328_004095 [Microctonus aethiopoides]
MADIGARSGIPWSAPKAIGVIIMYSVRSDHSFNQEEGIDRFDAWVKFLKMGKKISPSMQDISFEMTIFLLKHKTSKEPSDFNNDNNFQGFVNSNNQIDRTNEENLRLNEVINKFELSIKRDIEITSKQFNDVAIQVQTDHFISKFSDFISNDSELRI